MCFGATSAVAEEETAFSLDAEVAFLSDYMFRGINLYDGTSIQPSVTAGYDLGSAGAFSANVWNHSPAESDNKSEKFNEVDYTLAYSLPIDIVTLSGGLIWYTYSHDNVGNLDTEEFFVSAAVDTVLSQS